MQQLVLVIHLFSCLGIIILVLMQHGKGADIGAAFGSGASNTLFGSQGSTSFLLKITSLFAIIFFATSLTLGYMATSEMKQGKLAVPISNAILQQSTANYGLTEEESNSEINSNSVKSNSQSTSPKPLPPANEPNKGTGNN